MSEKQAKRTKDWREARRVRAWELKQEGWKQKAIAEALGVSDVSVSDWTRRARTGGTDALRSRPRRERPRRLGAE